MKKLASFLAEMVGHHLLPAVLYAIVFFKALQVMLPNHGDGLGQAFMAFIYFIPGLLAWMLVWYTVRKIYEMVSESADPPADSSNLDSAERLKLNVEIEGNAKGTPIKEGEEDKPGSSAGVWMGWFWVLVAVGWLSLLGWLFSH